MRISLFSKPKRSLTFSIVILLILSIFLSGYFYYFIPLNKDAIQKNGFLILQTIATNIKEKSSSHLTLFQNFYVNTKNYKGKIDTIEKLLKQNEVEATVDNKPVSGSRPIRSRLLNNNANLPDSLFYLAEITKGYFINAFTKPYYTDSIIISEPLESFLSPILTSQKSELFESYLLLGQEEGKKAQLVYKDADLGIGSDIIVDSLLPQGKEAYLAGVRDLSIKNLSYKLFYYPFDIGVHHVVLCGLVPTEQYNTSLHEVPFYFIYPLAIAFFLLVVLLPILKFYIMDSNEQVRLRDLVLFGLSVFIGASLITLIIIQYLLWRGGEERVKGNLSMLSNQISSSFFKEVVNNYNLLCKLDSFANADSSILSKELQNEKNINFSDTTRNFLKRNNENPTTSYIFSRISWVNDSGAQIVKAELYGKPVFTNVSDRKYYQAFKNDATFFVPDDSSKRLAGRQSIAGRTLNSVFQ